MKARKSARVPRLPQDGRARREPCVKILEHQITRPRRCYADAMRSRAAGSGPSAQQVEAVNVTWQGAVPAARARGRLADASTARRGRFVLDAHAATTQARGPRNRSARPRVRGVLVNGSTRRSRPQRFRRSQSIELFVRSRSPVRSRKDADAHRSSASKRPACSISAAGRRPSDRPVHGRRRSRGEILVNRVDVHFGG